MKKPNLDDYKYGFVNSVGLSKDGTTYDEDRDKYIDFLEQQRRALLKYVNKFKPLIAIEQNENKKKIEVIKAIEKVLGTFTETGNKLSDNFQRGIKIQSLIDIVLKNQ